MEKSVKANVMKAVAEIALKGAKEAANSSCVLFFYQPEVPEAVRKLRKF